MSRRISDAERVMWWAMNAPTEEVKIALQMVAIVLKARSGSSDVVARVKARVAKAKKTDSEATAA